MTEIPGQMPLFDPPGNGSSDETQWNDRQIHRIWEDQRATNNGLLKDLRTRFNRRPDAAAITAARLDALIDVLFEADERAKVLFEVRFEEYVAMTLRRLLDQLTKQTLLRPDPVPPATGRPLPGGSAFIGPDGRVS